MTPEETAAKAAVEQALAAAIKAERLCLEVGFSHSNVTDYLVRSSAGLAFALQAINGAY